MFKPIIHECDYQDESIEVSYTKLREHDEPAWYITVSRLATEEDVYENHYLDGVGDIIWQTAVTINNCPFCGLALSEVKSSTIRMQHIDCSGWHSKVL